ncbi:hypothetical protein IE81DRAFT_348144 [Ceraceosorus guamensis]|uniref:Uncharacterized protein n=1 Tax=Ceraceosorus guamensis TaxID=1522189 RepID=A0A316VW73_9BASI|nr:hypothetical protein IE81DRAFT_348144 [Ceraceosorus guamensis]PWN41692.1 hypothetical protein IE81DRAFT_348144 [Ceraceosorus guamensis]
MATITEVSKRSEVKEGVIPSHARSALPRGPGTLPELTVTSSSPRRTRSGRAAVATRAISTERQRVPKALRPVDSEVDRKDDRASASTKPDGSSTSRARTASPIATKEGHGAPSSTSITRESRQAKVAERLRQKAKRAASGKTLVSQVNEQAGERAGDHESHRQQEEAEGEDTMRVVLSTSSDGSSAHSTSDKENVPLAQVSQKGKAKGWHLTQDQENSGSNASSSFGKMEEQQHSTPIAARTSEQRARQDARVRTPLVALPLDDERQPRLSTSSILDAHRLGSRSSGRSNGSRDSEGEREGLNLGVIADRPARPADLSSHAQLSRLALPNKATFKNFDPSRRTTVRSPLVPANDSEGAFDKLRRERPEASSTKEKVARMFASPSSRGALRASRGKPSIPSSDAARSLEGQIRSEPLSKGTISKHPRAGQVKVEAPPIVRLEDESIDLDDPFGFEQAEDNLKARRAEARLASGKETQEANEIDNASSEQTSKTGAEDARKQETRDGSASSSQLERAQRARRAFSASNSIGSSESSLPDASTTLLQNTTTRRAFIGEQSMEYGGEEEAEITAELAPIRRSTRRKVATSKALEYSLASSSEGSATISKKSSLPSARDEVIAFSSTSSSSIKDADSETGSEPEESDRMTLDDLVRLLPRAGKGLQKRTARSSLGGATKRKGPGAKASTRTNSRSRTRATKKDAKSTRRKVDLVENQSESEAPELSGQDSDVQISKRRRKASTTAAGKVQSGKKQKKGQEESSSVGTRASSRSPAKGRRVRRGQEGSARRDVRDASAPASDRAGGEHQDTSRTRTRKRRIREMEELDRFQLESEFVI